ncbi:hypothetical protein LQV63_09985 [Paenibacillus profundus]|uniref:F5/8 type C domain-containing protein n=1 Tax=Paenibacillus profundus TaxID=1173085 RepID=A0ABS8YHJ8_9BACL|nr:hypothetical protein [Paenibacillus profundus]MCE5169642.1 hypothetical protein [Paenibacillus profundus]
MAIFGQVLASPESGWKRYDDSDSNIIYEGSGWERYSNSAYYNGSRQECSRTSINPKIKFNFIGSKIILISSLYSSYSNKIEIKIDEELYETTQISGGNIAVFFIKEGLKFQEHSVEITKINQGGYTIDFNLDAIDIDESGQLKPYDPLTYKFLIQSDRGYHSIFDREHSSTTAIPRMTSNSTPSGRAFAKDIYSAPYDAWKAFNQIDDNDGYCSQNGSAGVGFLGYEFAQDIPIFKYAVRSMNSSAVLNTMPKDWTFEGSFDGDKWDILDTQKNQTWTTINTDKDYNISTPKSYKLYRLNWTANNGHTGYTGINELKMYETPDPNILIHFPSMDKQSFVNHGMGKSFVIDLATEFTQRSFIESEFFVLGEGKVFKQKVDTSKFPIKKVSIE